MPKGTTVKKQTFTKDFTALPVTMEQFQELTNEVLVAINKVTAPHFLDADYTAQILMSAIHALDHRHGYVYKSDLFESCLNRISCHVTYHAVQEIQTRLKAKQEADAAAASAGTETPDNVVPLEQETTA